MLVSVDLQLTEGEWDPTVRSMCDAPLARGPMRLRLDTEVAAVTPAPIEKTAGERS